MKKKTKKPQNNLPYNASTASDQVSKCRQMLFGLMSFLCMKFINFYLFWGGTHKNLHLIPTLWNVLAIELSWGKRKETNEFKEKESVNLKVMERKFLKLLCGWMEMEKRTKLDLNISNRETPACPRGKVIEIKIYRENYCIKSSQPNCHLQPPTRWVGRWEEEMASWKCQIWINSANLLRFSLKTTAEKCEM